MSRTSFMITGVAVVVFVILVMSSVFTVPQTQQALVLQFGEPRPAIGESSPVIQKPGLKFKLPFIQNVVYFDRRVLDYQPPPEEIIASDQKRLVVDLFARFRIVDPLLFYQAVGSENGVRARLSGTLSASLRRVIGGTTLSSVLSEERAGITRQIREVANQAARNFGIDVVDVRIRRADLPEANAQAIYARMQSEREREAREFRAQGAELSQRIRSRADRERTVILAESQKQSEISRGQGDSEAIAIYADAFARDPDFYAFYRSLRAYRDSLGDANTTLVLSPDSAFFKYFGTLPKGTPAKP